MWPKIQDRNWMSVSERFQSVWTSPRRIFLLLKLSVSGHSCFDLMNKRSPFIAVAWNGNISAADTWSTICCTLRSCTLRSFLYFHDFRQPPRADIEPWFGPVHSGLSLLRHEWTLGEAMRFAFCALRPHQKLHRRQVLLNLKSCLCCDLKSHPIADGFCCIFTPRSLPYCKILWTHIFDTRLAEAIVWRHCYLAVASVLGVSCLHRLCFWIE